MSKFYKVNAKYTFVVTWEIKADNRAQAVEFADNHCGCVGPNYHSSLSDEDVDWNGDVHPSTKIIKR